VAHFNANANLVAYSKDRTREAYPGMTAIDFFGHEDDGVNKENKYKKGMDDLGLFYRPLLDDPGLNSITNRDETQNLLVYMPVGENTYDVLHNYFVNLDNTTNKSQNEPEYSDHYDSSDAYRRVAIASTLNIHGHIVPDDLEAQIDHLLVDGQDFNCPISYKFDNDHRMWYQRKPGNYAELTKGWEDISLPFSAELVTTQTKGEITHFYNNSTEGHEYWLREFAGNLQQKKDADNNIVTGVYTADFNYPAAGDSDKDYTNTFLWDYYYSMSPAVSDGAGRDKNKDVYQTYYNTPHTFEGYGYSAAATPYLIGFPGKTYYEFDLSGNFEPKNIYDENLIEKLNSQIITFASETGVTVAVSDDELKGVTPEGCGYTFMPNYMSASIPAGSFVMNAEGSAYKKTDAATDAVPFHPYIIPASSGTRGKVERIEFSQSDSDFGVEDNDISDLTGELIVTTERGKLTVKSRMKHTVDLHIYNLMGISYDGFSLTPGEEHTTRLMPGVYIVYDDNGKVVKKVMVK